MSFEALTAGGRLQWQPAAAALYRRADGQHATYLIWRDTQADAPYQMLDLREDEIREFLTLEAAERVAASEEMDAGRPEPEWPLSLRFPDNPCAATEECSA